jgi:molybdopterin-guanine dinucleotide biosynthesis protein
VRNLFAVMLALILGMMLFACVAKQRNILESSESQVKLRSVQSRVFDTADRDFMLRTIIATLQDLGFVIDDADKNLGTVSGTKRSGYFLRMTVSIRPRGEHQTMVRCNAQYNLQTVEDPEPYQDFFSSLSKALFLDAQLVEGQSAGGAKEIKKVAMSTESTQEQQRLTSASATGSTTKATDQPQETPKLASLPEETPVARVSLRRKPLEIQNEMKITDMLIEYDFFERSRNPQGSFKNVFVDNKDGTITDRATGLIWQKSGSLSSTDNRKANEYLDELNKQRFAGYSDWRMPTIEELASLLTRNRANGVYLDPVFSNRQVTCWTVDEREVSHPAYRGAWVVDFKQGQIDKALWLKFGAGGSNSPGYTGERYLNHVKAVR